MGQEVGTTPQRGGRRIWSKHGMVLKVSEPKGFRESKASKYVIFLVLDVSQEKHKSPQQGLLLMENRICSNHLHDLKQKSQSQGLLVKTKTKKKHHLQFKSHSPPTVANLSLPSPEKVYWHSLRASIPTDRFGHRSQPSCASLCLRGVQSPSFPKKSSGSILLWPISGALHPPKPLDNCF